MSVLAEFGIDSVLDALRTQDPFGIRSVLTEYSAQERPNLAEKGLILAIDRLLEMKVPGHAEWPTLPLARRCDWWVERLGGFAAVVAGLPRLSGAAADTLPIKDTLGAAVQAMVIGAVCREYGVEAHDDGVAGHAVRDHAAVALRRGDPGADRRCAGLEALVERVFVFQAAHQPAACTRDLRGIK